MATQIKRLLGEKTEAVDMKTSIRGNGKGGHRASTTFNGVTYAAEGWTEGQAMASLKSIVNDAIEKGSFDSSHTA